MPAPIIVETIQSWEYRGVACEVKSNDLGHYMGYVEHPIIPEIPPIILVDQIHVHGGITYRNEHRIGFDCAHPYDYCLDENGETWGLTGTKGLGIDPSERRVWRVEDVQKECERLVDQIHDFVGPEAIVEE